jgi:hypothetical protein
VAAELRRLKEVKPSAVFRLFLTNSLLETITKHTNEYAATQRCGEPAAGARAWVDVTSEEGGVWIGIVMYTGVHHSPAIPDYSKNSELSSVLKEQKEHSTGKGIRFESRPDSSSQRAPGGLCSFGHFTA